MLPSEGANMFTGIVEEIGNIKNIIWGSSSVQLVIECGLVLNEIRIGDSIAVNGVCLTVTKMGANWFIADVMPETMRKSSLSQLSNNQKVNLERALRLSDRLGGHIVSGHVDGIGLITKIQKEDNATWLTISANKDIMKYIIMKGSVTIDGTSLTVAQVEEDSFKISLIPHTWQKTILGKNEIGSKVNIECDIIGKYIEKLLGKTANEENNKDRSLTLDFLRENGF